MLRRRNLLLLGCLFGFLTIAQFSPAPPSRADVSTAGLRGQVKMSDEVHAPAFARLRGPKHSRARGNDQYTPLLNIPAYQQNVNTSATSPTVNKDMSVVHKVPTQSQAEIPETDMHAPRPRNFYEITARRDAEFEQLREKLGDAYLGKEESGYGAYQVWKDYWQQKLAPHGNFQIAYDAMNQQMPQPAACDGWRELGPFDMPLGTSFLQIICERDERTRGIGRINWITFDPVNANNVFVGSPKGGLFYSTDAGASWRNGGTDFLPGPNIGAAHVAIDPDNSFHWFLATEDGDGIRDGEHENGQNISHGVYRSLDKGLTWQKIGLDMSASSGFQIKKLVIAHENSQKIYAATSFGLYSTMNALADNPADVSWSLEKAGPFYDIAYQPSPSNTIYASGVDLVSSSNGGPWIQLPNVPFLPDSSVMRIAIEVTPANPNYLYVIVIQKGTVNNARLYRFNADSLTWVYKGPTTVDLGRAHSIGVSPINPNLIFIGDIAPVLKCTNGGNNSFCNWSNTTGTVHNDIHQVKFTPDGLTIYAVSDGGVYKSVDEGVTWTPHSKGLGVGQTLRMSTSATDPSLLLGGFYDTGSMLYDDNAGTWKHSFCGDGQTPIIDHIDPKYMFASSQSGYMFRSDDRGDKFTIEVSTHCPSWSTYAVLNPINTTRIYGACKPEVLRSPARGLNWQPISNFASTLNLTHHEVWKIYTAPSNSDYLYAHLVSLGGGAEQILMLTTNADAPASSVTWTMLPQPTHQWLTDIDVDDKDPTRFWVTYSGFNFPDQKVFYYDGTSYLNLTANLATLNLGVNSIVHHRETGRLFIGTTRGVYTATENGGDWTRVGGAIDGELPYIEVNDIEINYVANKLRAATSGRGIWEISADGLCHPNSCVKPPFTMTNWWPFDEAAGPPFAENATGNGDDGTYAMFPASPTPVPGKVANALAFDGNDYLTVYNSPNINLTHAAFFCSGFTIDAWIKTKQDTGVVSLLDKRANPEAPVGYHLFLVNGKLGFQLADGMPPGTGCGPEGTNPCTNYGGQGPNVADGVWHHIAATVQVHGSKTACPEIGNLYVDGNVVFTFVPRTHSLVNGNLPGSDIGNMADLYIGRRAPAFSGPGEASPAFFNGLIDELEFFRNFNTTPLASGALTQAQIQAIYNAGSAGKCKHWQIIYDSK